MIDTQHRMLVLLCRKLDIAIKSKVPDQRIRWIVLELKKFAEFHFLSEENLMHEVDYPDVDDHALLHFLNKWLVQHVATEDLKIAEYLRQSGKRPLGEGLYHEYLLSAPPGRV